MSFELPIFLDHAKLGRKSDGVWVAAAYKDAEGLKMLNRRLLIDVERGRTVKGWKPRRLGGGLGGRPKPVTARASHFLSPLAPTDVRGYSPA